MQYVSPLKIMAFLIYAIKESQVKSSKYYYRSGEIKNVVIAVIQPSPT